MPDPHDGPQPAEGTEGPFAKLNRKTSALDRLKAETEDYLAELKRRQAARDAQVADIDRRQEALNRKLDRWNHEFAELMDELVRRLVGTAGWLRRVDDTLGEIAARHPESRPDLDALRAGLRDETHRLSDHTDLMAQMAYRVTGLEPAGASKQTTPQIPYDRTLRRLLLGMFFGAVSGATILQLVHLLPISSDTGHVLIEGARALSMFALGVSITHLVLLSRARAYDRDQKT